MKIYTEKKEDKSEECFRVFEQDGKVVLIFEEESACDEWNLTIEDAYQLGLALYNTSLKIRPASKVCPDESASDGLKCLISFLKDLKNDIENSSK